MEVQLIKVTSANDGAFLHGEETLQIIKKDKNSYYGNGKQIEPLIIQNLFTLLEEPPMNHSECLSQLGVTQTWLDQNVLSAFDQQKERLRKYFNAKNPVNSQKQLYYEAFRDLKQCYSLSKGFFYGGMMNDDYPKIMLEIMDKEGNSIRISSQSQRELMLPWVITRDDQDIQTFNFRLSAAIARLLPDEFMNKQRIEGKTFLRSFMRRLSSRIMNHIKDEWDTIEADQQLGDQINIIKHNYIIRKSRIRGVGSVDRDGELGWEATLGLKEWPPNLYLEIHIPYDNGILGDLDPFLEQAPKLVKLVTSIPWLLEYITQNPNQEVEIRFVTNRSMSEKAQHAFLDDMRKEGYVEWAKNMENKLDQCCFLTLSMVNTYDFSRWIVLPDKNMVLWHFSGEKVALWDASTFINGNYNLTIRVFATISPDGSVSKKKA